MQLTMSISINVERLLAEAMPKIRQELAKAEEGACRVCGGDFAESGLLECCNCCICEVCAQRLWNSCAVGCPVCGENAYPYLTREFDVDWQKDFDNDPESAEEELAGERDAIPEDIKPW